MIELPAFRKQLEELLNDPDFIVRIKRRLGPGMWGCVLPVSFAILDALKTRGKADPRAPKD